MGRRLAGLLTMAVALAAAAPAGAAGPGATIWAGVPSGFGPFPAQDVNASGTYSTTVDRPGRLGVSLDGRYVVFASQSDGLSADDDDRFTGIFVRDRVTGTTTLVSRASGAAGAAANGDSDDPTISDDGRYVAFSSEGSNLEAGDDDADSDIFVRDLQTATTTLASYRTGFLGGPSDGVSVEPVISGDGTAVAFSTTATSLDSAFLPGPDGDTTPDIYRRLLVSPFGIDLVSRASGGAGTKGDGVSQQPDISDDGDVVVFASESTNLDAADGDSTNHVFRRVLSTTTTTLVSRASAVDGGAVANSFAEAPAVSGDGDRIAFRSAATNIDGPADPDSSSGSDIYLRRASTSTTSLVSRADGAAGAALNDASTPAISDDGGRIAFASESALTFPPVAGFDTDPVLERIPAGGTTTILSSGGPGSIAGLSGLRAAYAGDSSGAAVFAAGGAGGLTSDQDGLVTHVFFRQPPAAPQLVSRPTGTTGFVSAGMQSSGTGGEEGLRQISADGRYIVFTTTSPAVLGLDTIPQQRVVRRDLLTGETILVSRGDGPNGPPANAFAVQPSISADGNRVAFRSSASNLAAADPDGVNDVFVRDIAAGTTQLVSRADGPNGAHGNGGASACASPRAGGTSCSRAPRRISSRVTETASWTCSCAAWMPAPRPSSRVPTGRREPSGTAGPTPATSRRTAASWPSRRPPPTSATATATSRRTSTSATSRPARRGSRRARTARPARRATATPR